MKRMISVRDRVWLNRYYDMNHKFLAVMPIELFSSIAVGIMDLNQSPYRSVIKEGVRENESNS